VRRCFGPTVGSPAAAAASRQERRGEERRGEAREPSHQPGRRRPVSLCYSGLGRSWSVATARHSTVLYRTCTRITPSLPLLWPCPKLPPPNPCYVPTLLRVSSAAATASPHRTIAYVVLASPVPRAGALHLLFLERHRETDPSTHHSRLRPFLHPSCTHSDHCDRRDHLHHHHHHYHQHHHHTTTTHPQTHTSSRVLPSVHTRSLSYPPHGPRSLFISPPLLPTAPVSCVAIVDREILPICLSRLPPVSPAGTW
jgi:hypothetical protein